MADSDTIFEDGENLQAAIGKALQEKKALLCFVSDDGDDSVQWEVALLDEHIRPNILATTVALRLQAGSEQAGYLNAVCPVQHVPAVIIIFNAQVVANYQIGQTSFEDFQQHLSSRYGQDSEQDAPTRPEPKPITPGYIDLPPSEGRMRLPNNAYDYLRKLSDQYIASGVSGKSLLHIQLTILERANDETINAAVHDIQSQFATVSNPTLPDQAMNRLLNIPASKIQPTAQTGSNPAPIPATSGRNAVPVSNRPSNSSSSPSQSRHHATPPPPSQSSQPSNSSTSTSSAQTQRATYVAAQKQAEAERARIKAQIEADKKARKEEDRKAREEAEAHRRRVELSDLRKANSTTANPKSTDVRIQVRMFDGSTIRNSFAAEASIASDVRPWIDSEVVKKATAASQPYDLKLILSPLPNRTIEAGEEDRMLSDVENVKGSATMIMVPVKGYVDSYAGASAGSGVAGAVVGGVQTVIGTGVGLVGTAAGMAFGALGRLVGGGTQTPSQPQPQPHDTTTNGGGQPKTPAPNQSGSGSNVRIRSLADQRRDEEDEQRRRGNQLYNGMGLNVQPRREDNDDNTPR